MKIQLFRFMVIPMFLAALGFSKLEENRFELQVLLSQIENQPILVYKLNNLTNQLFYYDNRNGYVGKIGEQTIIDMGLPNINLMLQFKCNQILPKQYFRDTIFFSADGISHKPTDQIEMTFNLYKLKDKDVAECSNSQGLNPEIMLNYPIEKLSTELITLPFEEWVNFNMELQTFHK